MTERPIDKVTERTTSTMPGRVTGIESDKVADRATGPPTGIARQEGHCDGKGDAP